MRPDLAHEARRLGLTLVGVAPAAPAPRAAEVARWLEAGYAGDLRAWLGPGRVDPRALLPAARSVVTVALSYGGPDGPAAGRVARYAHGADYHTVLFRKLVALGERLGATAARPCVDAQPVLERDLAEQAGLGFIGKNGLLIAPGVGSWVLLGELLVDLDLSPTPPVRQRCGACTRCLDACPTRAFVAPWILDARLCISYLTIEQRGAIPVPLRPLVGGWVFGCDVCQEVCPFNAAAARRVPDPELAPTLAVDLPALLSLTSSGYRRLVAGRPLRRASRWQLLRNACVAAGNSGDRALVPLLERVEGPPLVLEHRDWALGRLTA